MSDQQLPAGHVSLGGRVHGLVPDMVETRLREKLAKSSSVAR